MRRVLCAAAVAVAMNACTGGDAAPGHEATLLVQGDSGQPETPTLSPDGSRLGWSVPVHGRSAIHVGDPDGGNAVQLTRGVWDRNPVWSPDGKWIAYLAEAPNFDIFVVPSGGGEPRQLTSGPAPDFPATWLPDGSGVVFFRLSGQIQTLVAPLDGSAIHPLVSTPDGNQFAAVSPDGKKVAWGLYRGGTSTIWVRDRDGGTPRQLTTEGLERADPAHMWSPDSRHLLYVSRRTGTLDLWIADVETGDLRQLTTDVRNDNEPVWSPDGRWVAFVSDRGGQTDLWIVPSAGGKARRVTADLAQESAPNWSVDGASILYLTSMRRSSLGLMNADGSDDRHLVDYDGYEVGEADLSPDDSTVIFSSNRSGNEDIWSVPLGGGEPAPLVSSPMPDSTPRYSPDGTQVAFVSTRAGSADLYVVPAAGGEARQLTDWPSDEGRPTWSPDGSRLAFTSDHDANRDDIWVIPAGGGEPTRITTTSVRASDLAWSPDGGIIYFRGVAPDGSDAIYRVAASGGTPASVGSTPAINIGRVGLSADGASLAYTALIEGWGYLDLLPSAGGQPRRLTTRTDEVYHILPRWSPDGGRIVVSDYDYTHDTYDLASVTVPGGEWTSLTRSPDTSEFIAGWTRDGSRILYITRRVRSSIARADVGELLTP